MITGYLPAPTGPFGHIRHRLGRKYRNAAAQSFMHGHHLVVGAGAACVLAAAVIALLGFRGPGRPPASWRPSTRRPIRWSAATR